MKKRIIVNPVGINNNSLRCKNSEIPAKMEVKNANADTNPMFKPAIVFGEQNIYLPNGKIANTVSTVETSFSSIDNSFINEAIQNQSPGINGRITGLIFSCIDNEISMIEGRYFATLENLKNVFVCHVNEIFYDPNTDSYAFKLEIDPFRCYADIGFNNIAGNAFYTVRNYNASYVSTLWKNGTIPTAILTSLNSTCIKLYNFVREQIMQFISYKDISTDTVENIFAMVDKYFTNMMADMTYETSVLFYHIEQIIPFIADVKKSIAYPVDKKEDSDNKDMIYNRYISYNDEYDL